MINPLYLPELRTMLAENNEDELKQFCAELHPARTADFMGGLTADEAWSVLMHADVPTRVSIFHYFDLSMQVEIVENVDRAEIAELIAELSPDERVDILNQVASDRVQELLPLLPTDERRDILHLSSYPEGTAGAVMTSDFAQLPENLTVAQALDELRRQAEQLETIYYLYIVDDQSQLRGLVSGRRLISSMGRPNTKLGEIMETGLVTADVDEDQEKVAQMVAKYDLLAIPVVDPQRRMLGIVTYDDVIDVVREEATEDALLSVAVTPLEASYLETNLWVLFWKRGVWLMVLFVAALLTAFALQQYEHELAMWQWLVLFIPLVVSCGGNAGNQSAALVITGMTLNDIKPSDWKRVIGRETLMGVMLGTAIGLTAMVAICALEPEARRPNAALVVPLTVFLVVTGGAASGTMLPLAFRRIGLDPALMSNPFVAGIVDILGIVIYMNVARLLL